MCIDISVKALSRVGEDGNRQLGGGKGLAGRIYMDKVSDHQAKKETDRWAFFLVWRGSSAWMQRKSRCDRDQKIRPSLKV